MTEKSLTFAYVTFGHGISIVITVIYNVCLYLCLYLYSCVYAFLLDIFYIEKSKYKPENRFVLPAFNRHNSNKTIIRLSESIPALFYNIYSISAVIHDFDFIVCLVAIFEFQSILYLLFLILLPIVANMRFHLSKMK